MAPKESGSVIQEAEKAVEAVKSSSLTEKLDAWGSSSIPSMGLATLIIALHARPLQPFPLMFAPALMFSSYVNVAGYAIDAAGMAAAWSGMYVLLSLRGRRSSGSGFLSRAWTPASLRTSTRRTNTPARRAVSAVAMGLGAVNCVAGGVKYGITGDRVKEAQARVERNRWGN
ncbi:uncharacterized protein SPSK_00338 [Sporothrix schenckii 1099-18]|uniref:Uncharacterized protein n=2 Tax=Sporothrix schenckii TaxID=29908 RepID=U7PHF9_SPOS1|nr:uncharacterized protein SPSK_00338 [Sporothrix schenckii 1099-18]ERS94947.1 hypothetical protein HMPREF1624_08658 [Sporothrix schenckii ATCC 58251]KJR83950.1 hypothetical protein SPSK_00338 [Sporothrix schenckii 1099-18]